MSDCPECDKHTEMVNTEPRRVIKWLFWYENGPPFSSSRHSWSDLPKVGAQWLVLYFNHRNVSNNKNYREHISGYDFYFAAPGPDGETIYGGNNTSREAIEKKYPGAIIVEGKWTSHGNMERITAEATTYAD